MKRFFAILLAIMIPLQSGWATIGPIAGMGNDGCEQGVTLAGDPVHPGGLTVDRSACDCDSASHSGAHGIAHSHACPHLGMATLAIASTSAQPFLSDGAIPEAKQASFVSIVLDVPSPPPTRLA